MMCKDIRYIDKAPPIEPDSAVHGSTPPPIDILTLLEAHETNSEVDTKSKVPDQQGPESEKANIAEVGVVVEAPPTESVEEDINVEGGLLKVGVASDNEATAQSVVSGDDMGVVSMEMVTSSDSFSSTDEGKAGGVKTDLNTDANTDLNADANTDLNADANTDLNAVDKDVHTDPEVVASTDAPPTDSIDDVSVPAKTGISINDNVDLKSVDTGVNITDNVDSTDHKSSVDSNTDTTIINECTDINNDETITEIKADLLPSEKAVTNPENNKKEHTPASTGPEAATGEETIKEHDEAAEQNLTEQTTAGNDLIQDITGASSTGIMNDGPPSTDSNPIPVATHIQTVPAANEGSHFIDDAPSVSSLSNNLISTPLVHDHSSVSSSPLDSTSKRDGESDFPTLISDADHESDFGDEKQRQKIKRSFTHRSSNKLSLPTDSDTTADDNDSVSQATPPKTTPTTKSLPKLTLDLSSQLLVDEVGGVSNNPDATVYHPLIVDGMSLVRVHCIM